MSDRSLDHLHPRLRPLCEAWLAKCGQQEIHAIVSETFRSAAQQDAYYAQGRTKPGKIITNARGGESKHNFTLDGRPASLAFDFAIRGDDGELIWDVRSPQWKAAVAIGQQLGLVWGGSWAGTLHDYDHFQIA